MSIVPRWRVAIADWTPVLPVEAAGLVVVRIKGDLRAYDPSTGAPAWTVHVDPVGGSGRFSVTDGVAIASDRSTRTERLTEIAIVRDGAVRAIVATDGRVGERAAVARAGELIVLVDRGRERGTEFRAISFADGTERRRATLPKFGALSVVADEAGLLVSSSFAPGLFRVAPDGTLGAVLEREAAVGVQLVGDTALAAVRDAAAGKTFAATTYSAASGALRWAAPAATSVIGLGAVHDALVAVSFDAGALAVPVARDATTGAVRWRGEALAGEPYGVAFVGAWVVVRHAAGVAVLAVDNGATLGSLEGPCALIAGHLYVALEHELACYDVPALST